MVYDHIHNDGRHADAHAFEHQGYNDIIPEGSVELGNDRQDHHGRQHRAEHRDQRAGDARQPVADDDGRG